MITTIKTFILATAGAALIVASPALAQTHKRAAPRVNAAPIVQSVTPAPSTDLWERGETDINPADPYGQIRGEYLKNPSLHNGNL